MVEYDGPPLQICFNAQYVSDFLAAVETEQVALEFKDEVSQAVMRPVGARGLRLLVRDHADAAVAASARAAAPARARRGACPRRG